MNRKPNKNKARGKELKFREAKKRMQRVRVQESTRIPKKQHRRWATNFAPMTPDQIETKYDPDYVAFCITKQLDEWDEFGFLWLRIAAAFQLSMFACKAIDRTGNLLPFDQERFKQSIEDNDFEHEFGLRFEADKFLCYLVFGDNPRFRALFGYVLVPAIKNDLASDMTPKAYNEWFAADPTADLTRRLLEFDLEKVE